MTFLHDKRAVSEVLGAILVFGILIAALGIYQAFIVPQANEQVEFSHNQEIQKDLVDLKSTIQAVERTGSSQTKSIKLATDYSNRIIAINPPTPHGTLRTLDTDGVTISNIVAIDRDERDFWNFEQGEGITYSSKTLEFEPAYNLFTNAPTSYIDHSVVYHRFDQGSEVIGSEQNIIQGNRISIGVLSGDRTFTDREADVNLVPISTGTTTVPVEANDGPLEIQIPTRLSNDSWVELLSDQMADNGGHVESFEVDETENMLTIRLEKDVTYNLQMAKVGIGPQVEDTNASYIVRAGGDEKAIEDNQEADLTAQVRDEFNNPVSGQKVWFDIIEGDAVLVDDEGNSIGQSDEDRSNSAGHTTVTVAPEKNNQTIKIRASIVENPDPDRPHEFVTFRLQVGHAAPSGFAEQLNPAEGVVYADAFGDLRGEGQAKPFTVGFENRGDSPQEVLELRINVVVPQNPGASTSKGAVPESVRIEDMDGNIEEFESMGPFEEVGDLDFTFSGNETNWYRFDFLDEDGDTVNVQEGDYFIMSFFFADNSTSTYIIAPRDEDDSHLWD